MQRPYLHLTKSTYVTQNFNDDNFPKFEASIRYSLNFAPHLFCMPNEAPFRTVIKLVLTKIDWLNLNKMDVQSFVAVIRADVNAKTIHIIGR